MAKIRHNHHFDTVDEVVSDATLVRKVACVQARDNFSMELMGAIQNR
ncbi:hypothetical protein [Sorangium sp. So ce1151]